MSIMQNCSLFNHVQETFVFNWEGLLIWENLFFTEVEVKEPLHVMIQITLYQLKSIDRDLVTLRDVTCWTTDDPYEQCVHCVWSISYGIHNLPGFHSILRIASNQDSYVRIQRRNQNVRQIGPARDILLGRNLVLCHRQWRLGIHSGQRNITFFTIPTNFKTRHCNARCRYITTMKCCDVDVRSLSTSIQLSHQLLRDYNVTAACVQESICGYLVVTVAKLDLHRNDRHGITGAFQVTTDSGNSDSCGRQRRHRIHLSQRRRSRRPWNDRVSVQGSGMRSLANITDSFLTTSSPSMTRAQTVKTQTVLHQKRHFVLTKDFPELPACLKCVLAFTMKTRRCEGFGRSIWRRNHDGWRDRQGVLGRGVLGLRAWLGLELVWSTWLSCRPTKHWFQCYTALLFHKFNDPGQWQRRVFFM